jgi:hypothetical protein
VLYQQRSLATLMCTSVLYQQRCVFNSADVYVSDCLMACMLKPVCRVQFV